MHCIHQKFESQYLIEAIRSAAHEVPHLNWQLDVQAPADLPILSWLDWVRDYVDCDSCIMTAFWEVGRWRRHFDRCVALSTTCEFCRSVTRGGRRQRSSDIKSCDVIQGWSLPYRLPMPQRSAASFRSYEVTTTLAFFQFVTGKRPMLSLQFCPCLGWSTLHVELTWCVVFQHFFKRFVGAHAKHMRNIE